MVERQGLKNSKRKPLPQLFDTRAVREILEGEPMNEDALVLACDCMIDYIACGLTASADGKYQSAEFREDLIQEGRLCLIEVVRSGNVDTTHSSLFAYLFTCVRNRLMSIVVRDSRARKYIAEAVASASVEAWRDDAYRESPHRMIAVRATLRSVCMASRFSACEAGAVEVLSASPELVTQESTWAAVQEIMRQTGISKRRAWIIAQSIAIQFRAEIWRTHFYG